MPPFRSMSSALLFLLALCSALACGCKSSAKQSAERARDHVRLLVRASSSDVEEVRNGLPKGAKLLSEYFAAGKFEDAQAAREVLDRARGKVQDLRVAKSTFFALVDVKGTVLRSDQEHDALSTKNLLAAFPELERALGGSYVETRGELAEAAGVRGRADAQWVAAQPVTVDGAVKGLYVTGWSLSSYAYRLENQLRSEVRSGLKEREKEPLVYVFVLAGGRVYGAPITPDVNAKALAEQGLPGKLAGADAPQELELEITGREFGAAYARAPALGPDVGIAVLRSET